MKKFLAALIMFSCNNLYSYSQSVTEYVSFDNYVNQGDNDLLNYFTANTGMVQITTNGITGGCLVTPLTENWGNDNTVYCSKYIDSATYVCNTRIAFQYDTTQLNSTNFDRAVSIFFRPSADFNHYIIASITPDKKIQIVSYFAANNPFLLNLVHNHWYDFILNASFVTPAPSYQIAVNVQVNDLGITGQNPPIPIGNSNLAFNDSLLFVDTAVQVSFSGTLWGGAKYLDNFRFQGVKSADSCITTTGLPSVLSNQIDMFVYGNTLYISNSHDELQLNLYSVNGQQIFNSKIAPGQSSISFNEFDTGLYMVRISDEGNNIYQTKKILITN